MTEQTDRLIAEIEKERTSERASIDFKFHYNTIGDCFYDIYSRYSVMVTSISRTVLLR